MHNDWNNNRYHSVMIALHWLTALLLIAVYALIELRDIYPKGSEPRELMKMWHFMLGLSVLCVAIARPVVRLIFSVPPITPTPAVWQQHLARLVHLALYVFWWRCQ